MTVAGKAGDNPIFRAIPSIDELLRTDTALRLVHTAGTERLTRLARVAAASFRQDAAAGSVNLAAGDEEGLRQAVMAELARRLESLWQEAASAGLRRVINATGVVIHTNLGRAPLSQEAVKAIADAASGYCTLEYDLATGKRGRRGAFAERLAAELCGADDAVIVNNCAAAALLVLSVLAAGREVIVSRGELVEIGGDFRVPDVLARSGCILREVGTTNRTKTADYERAINERTAMLLRVHPSNFRIVGFTAAPDIGELAAAAHANGLLLFEDAGSGALADLGPIGLGDEPVISRSIAAGADLVSFSGDKLLGGPQAGVIVGRGELIEKLRKDPLYRALRADKMVYAALEATLDAYARGTQAEDVPAVAMLSATVDEIGRRAKMLADEINGKLKDGLGVDLEIISGRSAVGGGAAPDAMKETMLIALGFSGSSAAEFESRLRTNDPPVIARIADGRVLIDLRTVPAADEADLISAIISAASTVQG